MCLLKGRESLIGIRANDPPPESTTLLPRLTPGSKTDTWRSLTIHSKRVDVDSTENLISIKNNENDGVDWDILTL